MGKYWESSVFAAIFGMMARKLPPDSKGKWTGFPYRIFWEEFGAIWDSLDDKVEVEGKYEALLAEVQSREIALREQPSFPAIKALVGRLELAPDATDALTRRLYRIAAAYCIPRLKKALGRGPVQSSKQLERVSRRADELATLLKETNLEIEIVLGLARPLVEPGSSPLFNFKSLIRDLKSLSDSACLIAEEIPRLSQGSSVSILEARLMEAATRAIGDASRIEISIKQTDGEKRKPRPGSNTGELLFRYLDLVEPAMTDGRKVRLFLDFNKAWVEVTQREIDLDIPPRMMRHLRGRQKLGT